MEVKNSEVAVEVSVPKNCTNCKYFNIVTGNVNYEGICNHAKHVGRLCTERMYCSEYAGDDSKPEKISLSLYNKIANDILLEVKPVKLRKRIIPQILDLIDEQVDKRTKEIFKKLLASDIVESELFEDSEVSYIENYVYVDDIIEIAEDYGVEV